MKEFWRIRNVPTDLGKASFRWREKVLGTRMNKEDAQLGAYLEMAASPAPDKHNYYNIVAEPYLTEAATGEGRLTISALVKQARIKRTLRPALAYRRPELPPYEPRFFNCRCSIIPTQ